MAKAKRKDSPRLFSLKKANAALPYVKRIVEDVQKTYRDLCAERSKHDGIRADSYSYSEEWEMLMASLNRIVDELHAVPVELKDFELGIVVFDGSYEGAPCKFVWYPEDDTVNYLDFHEGSLRTRQKILY